ncbi:MAG: hypothetical protein K6F72_05150 [Bacteroidales bacterium]|nr:hypothetical protein [Bacteroidales bacterium]
MKRLALILMLSLLSLASCSHKQEEMPLYSQYSGRQDLNVAQVSGFKLNDTVKVDVVLLVADDSAAWQGLKEEFNIRADEGITSWMGDIEQPGQRVKHGELPAWRAMAVHDERTVAFYLIEDEGEYEALLDYQMEKLRIEN